ncbi:hypothetical protein Pmani_017032 [Petrolisthes manimaculis]|uniref:Uncharacterized protein n=1 Tax=Petrolisthes manimaculis TaxID=1843537 RepID=A0AAE1PNW8_9EUCA|nr:hypothetical protein Pmani_017032 [Petrolisthes manimaculis]
MCRVSVWYSMCLHKATPKSLQVYIISVPRMQDGVPNRTFHDKKTPLTLKEVKGFMIKDEPQSDSEVSHISVDDSEDEYYPLQDDSEDEYYPSQDDSEDEYYPSQDDSEDEYYPLQDDSTMLRQDLMIDYQGNFLSLSSQLDF